MRSRVPGLRVDRSPNPAAPAPAQGGLAAWVRAQWSPCPSGRCQPVCGPGTGWSCLQSSGLPLPSWLGPGISSTAPPHRRAPPDSAHPDRPRGQSSASSSRSHVISTVQAADRSSAHHLPLLPQPLAPASASALGPCTSQCLRVPCVTDLRPLSAVVLAGHGAVVSPRTLLVGASAAPTSRGPQGSPQPHALPEAGRARAVPPVLGELGPGWLPSRNPASALHPTQMTLPPKWT